MSRPHETLVKNYFQKVYRLYLSYTGKVKPHIEKFPFPGSATLCQKKKILKPIAQNGDFYYIIFETHYII